jgi:hypothetical protein
VRNATKLRNILLKYSLTLDLTDEELFRITLMDKDTHKLHTFEEKSYTLALGKAFGHLLKETKTGKMERDEL